MRPIRELKLDPKNPRVHTKRQIRQIARSIEAFGFNVPILIDAQNRVIAGHGRLLACQELGWVEVPSISLTHLTEGQARAFVIADNRLTENASWDERLLGEQLKGLAEMNVTFSLEATGFDMGQIDLLIEGLAPASEGNDDPADAIPDTTTSPPVGQLGDLWLLGPHRLLCGNALDDMAYQILMAQQRATMVFADAPYNLPINGHVSGLGRIIHQDFAMASGEMSETEFTAFLTRVFSHLAANSLAGSLHFLFIDWRHLGELLSAGRQVYTELKNLCVWVKDHGGMGSLYRSRHELIFVFKYGTAPHRNNVELGVYGRCRTNVWEYAGVNSFARTTEESNLLTLHPTVKPVALVADALLDASARGDLVLDPFLGSGTTLLAAERTGRVCYALELEPRYADTAIRRWQAWTGQQVRHATTGKLFDELAQEQGGHDHVR